MRVVRRLGGRRHWSFSGAAIDDNRQPALLVVLRRLMDVAQAGGITLGSTRSEPDLTGRAVMYLSFPCEVAPANCWAAWICDGRRSGKDSVSWRRSVAGFGGTSFRSGLFGIDRRSPVHDTLERRLDCPDVQRAAWMRMEQLSKLGRWWRLGAAVWTETRSSIGI
ncbi:hypothetical protein CASFOL_031006 [Castilleja foliolosa]|uniref:Uncharacterized protein n=1 Tax=Castilleja foliolosa TaxID=1961234 RepID=A0ABD3C7J5_9LAMI